MNQADQIQHPQLVPHARYRWDTVRRQHQIVFPEGLLVLNETGAAIVKRCDGRSTGQLLDDLEQDFGVRRTAEVEAFLRQLWAKGLLSDAAR